MCKMFHSSLAALQSRLPRPSITIWFAGIPGPVSPCPGYSSQKPILEAAFLTYQYRNVRTLYCCLLPVVGAL